MHWRPLTLLLLAAGLLCANRCYESSDFDPTPALIEQALSLSTEGGATTLPADGISRLRIIAQITPEADLDKRTIVFTTSAGALVGGADGGGGAREVEAGADGQATIELQSSQQVEEAVVKASVKEVAGLTRQILIAFVAADPDEVIRFTVQPATAPADGMTLSAFTVALSPSLPLGTEVSFQTTLGSFAPEGATTVTRPADASFTATADLMSPSTLGTARIRATAHQVTREATLGFVRALPDRITVTTGGTVEVPASATGAVTVTATFLREVGDVTAGTVATFSATGDGGAPVGSFRGVEVVGTNGQAAADFMPGETEYRGPVTLTVGAEGSTVTGTAQVQVVDPG